jgi:hypothetical protein
MVKPRLQALWDNFPDHDKYPTMKDLYTWLGGKAEQNINSPGFGPRGNTCASRLSVALNKANAPVKSMQGVSTIGTADGSRIIYRVSEFRTYLFSVYGKPITDLKTPFDDAFKGKRGIIAFAVNWQDATGHIALWNGSTYREPTHDNYSAYVNGSVRTSKGEFWELP